MLTCSCVAGRRFWVLGWGKSGLSAAAFLRANGAEVYVWDDKEITREAASAQGFTLSNPALADFSPQDSLVLSPGVPLTHPEPHPAVCRARAAGAEILGDIELLFRACPKATYVGITGTNGKSTTTALIAHILQSAGRKTQVGGNLGTPALSLEALGEDGIYVLELSSFQLDLLTTNRLQVAVLLNITPDHFERHGGLQGYIAAKERIVRKPDQGPQTVIIGVDEPETRALADRIASNPHLAIQEISVLGPVEHGFTGYGNMLRRHKPVANSATTSTDDLLAFDGLQTLLGLHNAQNVAASFAACSALGVPDAEILRGLKTFPGLAHRQQLVAEIAGVRFINDSKATNADAAAKALVCYDNIHWIIGGKPKVGGLNGLEGLIGKVRHAYIIGVAQESFAAWCEGKIPFSMCGTLDVAIQKAFTNACKDTKSGKQVVLLSPACASFDQFQSFEERGHVFMDLTKDLQQHYEQQHPAEKLAAGKGI